MGDSWVASAFMLAFTIPNLFRRLLGEGAITAAFIPIFKEKERIEGQNAMWQAANAVISGLVVAATAIIGLVMLAVSAVLAMEIAQGETRLMLELLRAMFPYMLLVCLAAVFMGMLNARGHFFLPAMGATMLNVVMIASVLWLAPHFGNALPTQVFALAIGVLVAGLAQAGFQLPTLYREGFRPRWVTPWTNETVREVLRKMLPGTIGVAAFQINVLIIQAVAFWVGPQIVASFNYAVRLMELPQGIFGISLATYLLPTLAGLAADKKYVRFRATLGQGLGYLCFFNLLPSALLITLATPIVRLLFERGQFDEESTARAAYALACLAPGLTAYSVVNVLARAFYALGDTKTPMQISVFCLGLNLVFSIPLVFSFQQGGLGLANSLSSALNVWLLFYALRRKLRRLDLAALRRSFPWMLAAAALAGEVAWLVSGLWDQQHGFAHLLAKIGAVFVPMIVASLTYWLATLALKIPQARELASFVHKQ
jgi:putative peptidoglycan lipid II flippase